MGLISTLYNNVLRRSSTYALAIVTGAFFFERGFDLASENLYNEINRGVLVIAGETWKHFTNHIF